MKQLKKLFLGALCAPLLAMASSEPVQLDRAPTEKFRDALAIQRGAQVFVNYCLNCHSASYMRYNRLKDVGLTDDQIKDNLMFAADKVGETMKVGLTRADGKLWFGAAPPDLSVIARARASADGTGADWLYTYLRGFYRDENRPTGWNNVVFENVGMPHVLYGLQGQQVLNHETHKLELAVPGQLAPAEYDKAVSDLVSFMVWMGEPQQEFRRTLGIFVLAFLALLFVVSYALKKEYWKDIH